MLKKKNRYALIYHFARLQLSKYVVALINSWWVLMITFQLFFLFLNFVSQSRNTIFLHVSI